MPLALAITHPRLERCTIRTVVPTGGNVTPGLLLGWAPAVCLDDPDDVAFAFAVDDVEDVAGPELDDAEAVL